MKREILSYLSKINSDVHKMWCRVINIWVDAGQTLSMVRGLHQLVERNHRLLLDIQKAAKLPPFVIHPTPLMIEAKLRERLGDRVESIETYEGGDYLSVTLSMGVGRWFQIHIGLEKDNQAARPYSFGVSGGDGPYVSGFAESIDAALDSICDTIKQVMA